MKEWLLISFGILFLFGCAQVKYVKAGATEADFEADKVDCHNQALMSPIGSEIASGQMGKPGVRQGITTQLASASAQQDVDQCLQSKGWTLERQTK